MKFSPSEYRLKCIVVDDESMAISGLCAQIAEVGFLELVATCASALEASEVLQSQDVDLMFLDLTMPHLMGLDFLDMLQTPPLTIITTAYSEYAVDSYRLHVVDYLLKPYPFKRFFQAAERALALYKQHHSAPPPLEQDSLYIRVEDAYKRIQCSQIRYVEAMQNYLKLHFEHETYIIHQTMTYMESVLPQSGFFRIHKSYIINIAYIDSVFSERILVGKDLLPLSKYRRKALLDLYVMDHLISK